MYGCYLLRNNTDHEIAELACDTAIKTHNLLKHMEDFDDIKAGQWFDVCSYLKYKFMFVFALI